MKAKEYREKIGMTQTEAAVRAGISRAHLSVIESGKGNPSMNTMQKLAEVYGVPVAEIFFDDGGLKNEQKKDVV